MDIVLTTFNARFIHASFGLRYLKANLGALQDRCEILEFTTQLAPIDIVEQILVLDPKIVGIGVYIWNAVLCEQVIALLKALRPELILVIGGPEVSHEWAGQPIVEYADYLITGEAEVAFRKLCGELLEGDPPATKIIHAEPPTADQLEFPYALYTDADIAHRIIYVEASRGCPFKCEFCLSSLARGVRKFPLEPFLAEMQSLFERGVRQFKFVDRTFNLDIKVSRAILQFFLDRYEPGLFAHFEMIPDRLPADLKDIIKKFPPGVLQFEVGIQTFSPEVAARISRRQNYRRLEENFAFLREETGVHSHADLIVGLPGESLEGFAEGFNRLMVIGPQEIQVGILKRLRGTPIARHTEEWEMVYSPHPPYEILQNKSISFTEMQTMRRFTQLWDRVANSGKFTSTVSTLWAEGTPFDGFLQWTLWVVKETGRSYGISLMRMMQLLFKYLTEEKGGSAPEIAETLLKDYWAGKERRDIPKFLRKHLSSEQMAAFKEVSSSKGEAWIPKRQAMHQATAA